MLTYDQADRAVDWKESSDSLSSSSGSHSVSGSKRAIDVVTHLIFPATEGEMTKGVSAFGNSPGPKSDPSGMTAARSKEGMCGVEESEQQWELFDAADDGVAYPLRK